MKVPECLRQSFVKFDCQNKDKSIFLARPEDKVVTCLTTFLEIRIPIPEHEEDVDHMQQEILAFFREITNGVS